MSKNIEIAETVEYILCETLRGEHIDKMNHEELKTYIQRVGIALHGLPMSIATAEKPCNELLNEIDRVDPEGSATNSKGPLVRALLGHF